MCPYTGLRMNLPRPSRRWVIPAAGAAIVALLALVTVLGLRSQAHPAATSNATTSARPSSPSTIPAETAGPSTASASPTSSATVLVATDQARAAAEHLWAGLGSPPAPGSQCFSGSGDSAPSFAACPVTARLATRLRAVNGVGFFVLFEGYNGPAGSIAFGPGVAGTSAVAVTVTFNFPSAPFAIDAVVINSAGRWLVDDLLFHGNTSGDSSWQPDTQGGPWSVFDACFSVPYPQGSPGKGC
jgi:hypothetical protein